MKVFSDKKIEQMMEDNSYIETTLRGNKNNSNKGKYNDNPNKWFLGRLPNMLRLGWAERMDALAPNEWLMISQHEFYPEGILHEKHIVDELNLMLIIMLTHWIEIGQIMNLLPEKFFLKENQ